MNKHEEKDHGTTGWRLVATALLAAAVLLTTVLLPTAVRAACPGTGDDTDCDGFTNVQETAGIPVPVGFTFADRNGVPLSANALIPACPVANTPYPDRNFCLDPATADTFVILSRAANGSLIPANPWNFVNLPKTNGGLGIAVHELKPVDPQSLANNVTPTQKAVYITESLSPKNTATGDTQVGKANHTTPNLNNAYGTVWTQRIDVEVLSYCTSAVPEANCKDIGGTSGKANIRALYIQHTLAHEMAHMLYLTTVEIAKYAGWHYQAGSGYVLDQNISPPTSRGGVVTFKITKNYTAADQTNAALK